MAKTRVEHCFQISVFELWRNGSIASGIEHWGAYAIDWTPCNYGGDRPWLKCPKCSRRCGKLYAYRQKVLYLCRRCMKLDYLSSLNSEDTVQRRIDRIVKLKLKLRDIEPLSTRLYPPAHLRPKGMHFRTWLKIIHAIEEEYSYVLNDTIAMLKRMGISINV